MTCFEALARQPEHETMDSLVVCLLSHGKDGAVYGTDGEPLQVCWINHQASYFLALCFLLS